MITNYQLFKESLDNSKVTKADVKNNTSYKKYLQKIGIDFFHNEKTDEFAISNKDYNKIVKPNTDLESLKYSEFSNSYTYGTGFRVKIVSNVEKYKLSETKRLQKIDNYFDKKSQKKSDILKNIRTLVGDDTLTFDGYDVNDLPIYISKKSDSEDVEYIVSKSGTVTMHDGTKSKRIGKI